MQSQTECGLVVGDIGNEELITRLIEERQIDLIMHFAALQLYLNLLATLWIIITITPANREISSPPGLRPV